MIQGLDDENENSVSSTSDNLEKIRYRLLEQFCSLMQLNTYIHNFGQNSEKMIEESMAHNINMIHELYENPNKRDPIFLEKLSHDFERNKKTLKLLYSQQEHFWKKSKVSTQTAMLDFNELASEIATMLEKLEFYSLHDTVTELPNRRYFNAISSYEISRSERHNHTFCVLMMDLDNFKKINDTFGHGSGDELLRKFARLIREKLRKSDIFARLGGDEFAILLVETNKKAGEEVAQSIIDTVSKHKFEDSQNNHLVTSVSIGIANYPIDALTFDSIVKNADAALYVAKEKGKNQFISYQRDITKNE